MNMKEFRALTWTRVYEYGDDKKGFKVFGCSLPDFTIAHDYQKGKRTKISFRVARRTTESPSVAVKWWNARQKLLATQRSGTEIGNSPKAPSDVEIAVHRR